MKSFLQLREATNRTKRNPTRDFLRKYPVSDAEMAKPVKKPEKKKPEQVVVEGLRGTGNPGMPTPYDQGRADAKKGRPYDNPYDQSGEQQEHGHYKKGYEQGKKQGVAEATVDIADIEKKKNISPKDKNTLGKVADLMARERALQQAKLAKTTKAVKEERESVFKSEIDEAGPFSYGAKPPRKGSVAYYALMKRKEQDKNRVKEIEAIGTKNHHIGVAKVTKEEIEDVTEAKDDTYKYIDQSGGHQIKGKSGTYVGYTHSATKGKGANILKHNKTKKYYAAGGSSTAFTAKTTLHDTPEDAARAYHKGNLAEEKLNSEAYMGKIKPQKSPQQKFKDSMKRAGYDMDAGAKRLQDLLAKHKKEREDLESKYKD